MSGLKQVPSIEKSHNELAGVHRPIRSPTVTKSVNWHHIAIHHRNHLWYTPGFISRVKSDTTASLGRPKDMMPGHWAAVVHSIPSCCCSKVSSSRCLPIPEYTASVESEVEM